MSRKRNKGRNAAPAASGGGNPAGNEQKQQPQAPASVSKTRSEPVIREMVFETAAVAFRKNKAFVVKRDGQDLFVGAYMPFDRIGGLSAKDKSDESKGSIINLINTGRMLTLFTPELADEDAIVFIPNKDTLACMDEYTVLAEDAVYDLCLIDPTDESIEKTKVQVNLAKLQSMFGNNAAVLKALGDVLEDTVLEEEQAPRQLEDVRSEIPAEEPSMDDVPAPEPEFVPEPDEVPPDDDGFIGPESIGSGSDDYVPDYSEGGYAEFGIDGDSGVDADGLSDDEEPVYEDEPQGDVIVDEGTVQRALARRFFNDELDRTLDTSGLDQALEPKAIFRGLDKRAPGWLDEQLNVMIDMANKELFALHQANLMHVRQEYLDVMGAAYEREMGAVNLLDDDPNYQELQRMQEEYEEKFPSMLSAEREQLEADWVQRVKDAGESARVAAEQTYRERYHAQHEEQLRNLEQELRSGMQVGFDSAVGKLKTVRRREAELRLDALDTEQIKLALERFAELEQSEIALLEKHKAAIIEFMNSYREAEITRIKVLEEEHAQRDKITELESQHRARFESLMADFEARIAAMNQDRETMRKHHEDDLREKDKEREKLVNQHAQESERQQARIDELLHSVGEIEDKKMRDAQRRIEALTDERDSIDRKYDHLADTQKKLSVMVVAVMTVALLAVGSIGFLIGHFTGLKAGDSAPAETVGVVQTVNPEDAGASTIDEVDDIIGNIDDASGQDGV